jgi:hypothetical protein
MKTKAQLTEALTAKGVEIPANLNKAALEQLALANGIPLEVEAGSAPEVQPAGSTALQDDALQDDSELIASKVAAGLSYEGALEVIKRQREEDAKAKA